MPLLARIDVAEWDNIVAAADFSTVIRDKSKQCRVTLAGGGECDRLFHAPTALLDLRATQDGWSSAMKQPKPA